jgi:hypothetical protein
MIIAKLAGENLLRVLSAAEAKGAELRRSRPASTAAIANMDGTATTPK